MSIRSLIEFNHDFAHDLGDEFLVRLGYYLKSGDPADGEWLKHYGVTVLGTRHHSGNFFIVGTPNGFPVRMVATEPPTLSAEGELLAFAEWCLSPQFDSRDLTIRARAAIKKESGHG